MTEHIGSGNSPVKISWLTNTRSFFMFSLGQFSRVYRPYSLNARQINAYLMDLSVLEFSRAVCCEEPIFAECLTWSQKQTLAVISDAFQANFAKYKKEFPNVHLTVNRRKQQEKKLHLFSGAKYLLQRLKAPSGCHWLT